MSSILHFRTCCQGILVGEDHTQEASNWHGDMYLRNKIQSQDRGLRHRKSSQHRGDRDTHTRVGQPGKKRVRKGKNKIVAHDQKPLPFQLLNPSKVIARTKVEDRKTIAFATPTLQSPKIRLIKAPQVAFTYQQPMRHSPSDLTFRHNQPPPPSPPSTPSTPSLNISPFQSLPSIQIEAV